MMLSRIADSLFWLNRYMERADGLLRVVRTNYIMSLDKGSDNAPTWRQALTVFARLDETECARLEHDTPLALKTLLAETDNVNSLRVIVTKARENARGAQDHISKEVWEQLNQMYHFVNQPKLAELLSGAGALESIDRLMRQSMLFNGIAEATMPRALGWRFLNLGRYIERSLITIEMSDRQFAAIGYNLEEPREILQWKYLLLSLSGYELHLKMYRTSNASRDVLHQVLFDPSFTRSVIYALGRVDRYFTDVLAESNRVDNVSLSRYFKSLYSSVRYTDVDIIPHNGIQAFFSDVKGRILEFGKRLSQSFFSYS
ncbi:MAG TPA: alpha-E domain-containing protein [Bacteroidota bacterium]|nr:alpha-E domain-containing protein [Bacteroidota bacterium]